MQKEQIMELLKSAVQSKQDGLKFSVEVDAEKILKEVVMVVVEEFVKDSSNPYDDKLLEMLKPFIEAKLA